MCVAFMHILRAYILHAYIGYILLHAYYKHMYYMHSCFSDYITYICYMHAQITYMHSMYMHRLHILLCAYYIHTCITYIVAAMLTLHKTVLLAGSKHRARTHPQEGDCGRTGTPRECEYWGPAVSATHSSWHPGALVTPLPFYRKGDRVRDIIQGHTRRKGQV